MRHRATAVATSSPSPHPTCPAPRLLATASVLAGEGVRSVILVVYPVILIVAGWTLGSRYCLGLLAASCIALVLMALSQQSGRLDVALTLTPTDRCNYGHQNPRI